ncbi:MAG TPA: M48 family metallopeptidase [Acidobacteriota bacterium]|nr:M48 family metallopeptidase [Acidobacteriota bacterium]
MFFDWWSVERKRELPPELSDVTTPEQFEKINAYTRVRSKFSLIKATFALVVLLAFWFSGGFNALDEWVRSFDFSTITTGIIYIGILGLANSILSLPFDLYSTFVIEERFGFNKTTLRLFFIDRIKGLMLALVLGVPLIAVILWFFERTGSNAWLYCWIVSVAFSLALQYIAPVWILSLFNKYTPLPDGDLRHAILNYAQKVHFPFKEIFVMDSSKRSTKSNAFFTGFGKYRRIALFDTLVSGSTDPEILTILAHEVGHYKKRHIITGMLLSFLYMGFVFYLLSIFINKNELFDAFYMKHVSVYAGLVFFGLLFEPISFLSSIAFNAFSRHNEREADQYAIETTSDYQNLISALKKLYANNLANLTPHPLYVFLNYTHPPLLERIRLIRATEEHQRNQTQQIQY